MKKIILILFFIGISLNVYAKDFARRYPTDTALEVETPSSAGIKYLKLDCSNSPLTGNLLLGTHYLQLSEIPTPATPPANTGNWYTKDDGSGESAPYFLSDAGVEYSMTGGGGGATNLPALTDVDDALLYTNHFILQADGSQYTAGLYSHTWLNDIGTNTHPQIDAHIANNSIHPDDSNLVHKTGDETIAEIKTFTSFPITPSSSPITNYQVANKAYVDAIAAGLTWKKPVIDKDLSDPPGSPSSGDRYIVKPTGINAWTGHDNDIAEWNGSSWGFADPLTGWAVITLDDSKGWTWDGSTWIQFSASETYTASLGVEKVGNDFRLDYLINQGLALSTNSLKVDYDDSSIGIVANKLAVKALGITNAMLAGLIADTKLNQITTPSKISGAALTSLASIPAGAGVIPIPNLATGTPTGSKFIRDDGTLAIPAGAGAGVVSLNYTKALTTDATATTVGNTATETTVYTYSVPANILSTNRALRIVVTGTYSNNSGSNKTLTLNLYYGGTAAANLITTAVSGNIPTSATAGSFTAEFYLIANGATNAQTGNVSAVVRTSSSVQFFGGGVQRTIDSTSAQNLYVRVKHSAAHASTTLTTKLMHIELLNATDNIGAPTDASYWTATSEVNLSAEVNLGALTTGLLKHTVTGGVSTPTTAIAGTDYENPLTFISPLFRSVNTISLAGLSSLGTGNYLVGVNAGATAWEYKNITGVASEIDITHSVNGIAIGIVDPLAVTKGGLGLSSITQYHIPYATLANTYGSSVNMIFDGTNFRIGGATNNVNNSATGTTYAGTARPQRTFYVDAAGMWPSTTSGSAALTLTETATNKINYYYLAFDGATAENAEFSCPLPKTWNGGTVTFIIHYIPTGTTGGTGIVWGLKAVCIGDNVNIDTAYGTAVTVTDTIQTANYVHISPESGALTIAGTLAGEKPIHWKIYRDAAAAGDTNTDDARLTGVMIKYTVTQETDD